MQLIEKKSTPEDLANLLYRPVEFTKCTLCRCTCTKKAGKDGPAIAGHASEPARHEITISEKVSQKLELAYLSESLRICRDD